ncbi:MAG: hypothetical protein AMXMBFR77_27860 [Phycisphaerales bacterium]
MALKLRTYKDVDKALERLLAIDRQVELAAGDLDEAVAELRKAAQEDTEAVRAERAALATAIFGFLAVNKADFTEKRSRSLEWGRVGLRRSESMQFLAGMTEEDVVRLCKEHGAAELIREQHTESIDRKAAAAVEDGALEVLGLQRVVEDRPYFESTAGLRKISAVGPGFPVKR